MGRIEVINKVFCSLKPVGFKTPVARLTEKETTKISNIGDEKKPLRVTGAQTAAHQVQIHCLSSPVTTEQAT